MRWRGFLALLSLGILLGCPRKESVAPPTDTSALKASRPAPIGSAAWRASVPSGKMRVAVTISVTGVSHLADDGGNKLIVIPNGVNWSDKHELLLLVPKRYSPSGLAKGPKEQKLGTTVVEEYFYSVLTPGIEIDLVASGFDSGINPTLHSDTTGDATDEPCPVPILAPETSLHWLPQLGAVSETSGAVVDLDQTKPVPDPATVAARMNMTGGILEAQLPSAPDVFTFDTNSGAAYPMQAVADRVNYTFFADVDAITPKVTLYGKPYGGASAALVTANVSKVTKKVHFVLANVPFNDFFVLSKDLTLKHFHYAYGIYKPIPNTFKMATPKRGESCGGGVGGGVECGPDRLP